ncbi:SDR family NAD(P)-dependent oxidoreductase [Dactylosporangium sp. CA-233914]|uniref:SDR family NAD(P)-dependent oxidoreductase n=1 Tax=Dactylosporangium sp. CA-233914 TaxID=3239934 RepID=UPI003D93B5D9
MDQLMAGRVALVTGAASGIGRATAVLLASEGATVVVADRLSKPREGGDSTADVIRAAGGRAEFVTSDVTLAADRAKAVAIAEELGGLDVLVNNAGVFAMAPFLDVTEDDFDRMSAVNARAAFFMAQEAARAMIPRGNGVIVNLSSVAGLQGAAQASAYCTTKFAVRGLTLALADELGPQGIRVNAVHPGFIETTMTRVDVPVVGTQLADAYLESIPLRRAGTAEDVARSILLLASDLAGYVSGASLVVDGGRVRV